MKIAVESENGAEEVIYVFWSEYGSENRLFSFENVLGFKRRAVRSHQPI